MLKLSSGFRCGLAGRAGEDAALSSESSSSSVLSDSDDGAAATWATGKKATGAAWTWTWLNNPHRIMSCEWIYRHAVLAVVVLHFFPDQLPYGYLGVDIFFVLSGYLITLVLHKKDHSDCLAYIDFYFKRIRRILPMSAMVSYR